MLRDGPVPCLLCACVRVVRYTGVTGSREIVAQKHKNNADSEMVLDEFSEFIFSLAIEKGQVLFLILPVKLPYDLRARVCS